MPGPDRFLLSSCLLLVLAGTAAAQSQPSAPQPVGLSLGLRVGYGMPGGKVGSLNSSPSGDDTALSDGVEGMIPFWLDLGYRITPHLGVGASLQYGFGLANKEMGGCPECTIDNIAFGANLYLHARPDGPFDPWAGIGIAYEILGISSKAGGGDAKISLEGFQFLVLQAGGDFATGTAISVGPFFCFSLGKYDSFSVTGFGPGGTQFTMSDDIGRTAWHQWFTLGVRGAFNL